ncbi:MAG TPA: taurine ABC transporter permease, partial [Casimicrobiaceae bacterium]
MTAVHKPGGYARPKTSKFATPGEGSSTAISVATMVGLLVLWWLASHLRWLPPLFLPTPETVFARLYESALGKLTDAPLAEHFGWSIFRVFTAFIAASLTAIPIGIAMGVSRVARGIFDPPIEFYRPLPPLA